jgi:proteasome accessory factor C
MPDTASAQLRRILALIPRLADDRPHSYDEIAKQLGVDRDTIVADLRSIAQRFDEPGGFLSTFRINLGADDVSVVAMHFHRPMRLTLAELGALELGLALLRAERAPEERKPIDRARDRLRKVIAKLPKDPLPPELHVAADAGTEHDRTTLAQIGKAMRGNRKVRITYRGSAATRPSQRLVCPYQYTYAVGAWYLIAHCEKSKGIRVFRVDRIERIERTEETYRVPDDFSAEELVKDGRVFQGETDQVVQVRYGPAVARWIAEREGCEPAADGSLTLEYPLADPSWLVRHVLQYGADAEVVGPEGAREVVRTALERIVGIEGERGARGRRA